MDGLVFYLFIALVFAVLIMGIGRSKAGAQSESVRVKAGRIDGNGEFEVQVKGTSYYQSQLESIAGPKEDSGKEMLVSAEIKTEPDNPYDSNACGVYIQGQKVGHLPK